MSNTSGNITSCANCGKGEEAGIKLKACTACKLVKYCGRDCQIAHRPQHKKECKKRAAELHDEKLFEQPPPMDDCSICMVRLPSVESGRVYMSCCGKILCTGCIYAVQSRAFKARKREDNICPFCRTPGANSVEEKMKRLEKRIDLNDSNAINNMGCHYAGGHLGVPRNFSKALELWYRAAELGDADAYYAIGNAYKFGDGGVEVNEKKAIHNWELAAMGGHRLARHNLGNFEGKAGNMDRALKHFMIAVKDGDSKALQGIKRMHEYGDATKDDYTNALQSYQSYLSEIKSNQRDEAAFDTNDLYKYYESAL